MNSFSGTLSAVVWFIICVAMAVGMLAFAVIYGVFSVIMKRFAWKEVSISFPSFKIAR